MTVAARGDERLIAQFGDADLLAPRQGMVWSDKEADCFLPDDFRFQFCDRSEIDDTAEVHVTVGDGFDRLLQCAGVHHEFDILLVSNEIADRSSEHILRKNALGAQCEAGSLQTGPVWCKIPGEKACLLHQTRCSFVQSPALLGQVRAQSLASHEQLATNLSLERLDVIVDGGMRNSQSFRAGDKTARFDHGDKDFQTPEGRWEHVLWPNSAGLQKHLLTAGTNTSCVRHRCKMTLFKRVAAMTTSVQNVSQFSRVGWPTPLRPRQKRSPSRTSRPPCRRIPWDQCCPWGHTKCD